MTPLALRLFRELLQPEGKRKIKDTGGTLRYLADIHCFQVSAIYSLAGELAGRTAEQGFDWSLTFLPFPRTWLEFGGPAGSNERNAFLLCAEDKDHFWHIRLRDDGVIDCSMWQFVRPSPDDTYRRHKEQKRAAIDGAAAHTTEELLLAILSIINTPRLFARDEHPPHKGLVRDLHRAGHDLPIHASTTIRLDIEPSAGEARPGARLTGPKALHWCRAHLRLQLGKIVLVKAHQRGSEDVGTRDADYAVKRPKSGGSDGH